MNDYLPAYKIQKEFKIPTSTLRSWSIQGKIRSIRLRDGGKRYYSYSDIKAIYCEGKAQGACNKKRTLIYARVSSTHQKQDLESQIQILQTKYPEAEVIQDIGSTLNYKRKGLQMLLDKAHQRSFDKLVILYKDRLCRFSYDLIESVLRRQGVAIEVVSMLNDISEGGINTEQEMAGDLLAVVNYFVAKNNGKRSKKNKEIKEQQAQSQ